MKRIYSLVREIIPMKIIFQVQESQSKTDRVRSIKRSREKKYIIYEEVKIKLLVDFRKL